MTTNRILAGLLAVQLALAAVTWWPQGEATQTPVAAIAAPDSEWSVIEIAGQKSGESDPKPVRLVRNGTGWTLSSAGGYPADATRVKDVVDNLAKITLGTPLSTKATSHRDLGVAESEYTRKITVGAGGQTTTLYLGAGSGSAVNVRLEGTDAVYAVRGFTAWSIGDADARYYDSVYVKVDPKKLRSLKVVNAGGAWTLVHGADDTWSIAEAPESVVDTAKITSFARRAVDLRMAKPVGQETAAAYGLSGATRVEYTAEGPDGAPLVGGYAIGSARETFRYVKADDKRWIVEVAAATLQPVLDFAPTAVTAVVP